MKIDAAKCGAERFVFAKREKEMFQQVYGLCRSMGDLRHPKGRTAEAALQILMLELSIEVPSDGHPEDDVIHADFEVKSDGDIDMPVSTPEVTK